MKAWRFIDTDTPLVLSDVDEPAAADDDCAAVLGLMADGTITSRLSRISFDEIAEGIERLARGEVSGRVVTVFD